MPIPFQACETKRTILAGAVLQNPARCRFCENEKIGRATMPNFPLSIFALKSSRSLRSYRYAQASSSLDTGPPDAHSFAELILQRSLFAHAPPFRA